MDGATHANNYKECPVVEYYSINLSVFCHYFYFISSYTSRTCAVYQRGDLSHNGSTKKDFSFFPLPAATFIFFNHFIHLHFKWYSPSRFLLHKPLIPSPLPFASMGVLHHPLLWHPSSMPLRWTIKPPEDQEPSFPWMPDKATLCYIWSWSHESLHVHSFVVGLVPGSARWSS